MIIEMMVRIFGMRMILEMAMMVMEIMIIRWL